MSAPKEAGTILVADRFAPLRRKLMELFEDLSDGDWMRPTQAGLWTVKDIAAHLLGGDVAILSGKRDGFRMSHVVQDNAQLIALVDRLNHEWIVAMNRVSPRLLCEFFTIIGPEVDRYFASLDPHSQGGVVSWAGPEPAPVWLDIARELTERWHHQQQIRDATGRSDLYDPYFLGPVLDAFVRALPHTYRTVNAPEGTAVQVEITGDAGSVWYVYRNRDTWSLLLESPVAPSASVALSQDVAWRLFTKGIDRLVARSSAITSGDEYLVHPFFRTTAIIG